MNTLHRLLRLEARQPKGVTGTGGHLGIEQQDYPRGHNPTVLFSSGTGALPDNDFKSLKSEV